MFKSLSLGRQIIVLFIALALVAVVLAGGTLFYKNSIKSDVVKDLTIDTNKLEGEAIEQANDIDAMHSQLSDSAVDAGLRFDFRTEDSPEGEQVKRVQNVSGDQTITSGHNRHETTGVQAQQPIPQPLPGETTEWQPDYSLEPCRWVIDWGFDNDQNIIELKVCE